ncbi:hypothetical protein F5884DRAFT_142265 [Xylogone sp. PMI_703]|nr:hypothetical protein F5884DRAFT_142265 [Xylogone sp. PMI_703]
MRCTGMLHRSVPTQQPAMILLAIIFIGASYTGIEGSRDFAEAVAEITRRLLWFMAETDAAVVQSESYLVAQILLCHYARGSGNEQILNISETARSSMVVNATNAGLFQRPSTCDPPDGSLELRWAGWIARELRCRLAWEIFEFDASEATISNKRPFISLFIIQIDCPCSSTFWEAETAQSWAALCPLPGSAPGVFFPVILNNMFHGSISEVVQRSAYLQHQRILVHTLSRMIWQLKEMQSNFPIYKPRQPSFIEGELRLGVRMLDRFGTMNPLCGSDWLKVSLDQNTGPIASQTFQVIHVARIHITPGLVDSIYQLLKNRGADFEKAVQFYRCHLRQESEMRRVAFHCAQVLAVCRRYPSGAPCEPFNVFHAGLALWLVMHLLYEDFLSHGGFEGRCHSSQNRSTTPTTLRFSQARQLRLDGNFVANGSNREIQNDMLHQWLWSERVLPSRTATQTDDSTLVLIPSIHGISDLSSAQGLRQILVQTADILENMPVWSIAIKLRELIIRLL